MFYYEWCNELLSSAKLNVMIEAKRRARARTQSDSTESSEHETRQQMVSHSLYILCYSTLQTIYHTAIDCLLLITKPSSHLAIIQPWGLFWVSINCTYMHEWMIFLIHLCMYTHDILHRNVMFIHRACSLSTMIFYEALHFIWV